MPEVTRGSRDRRQRANRAIFLWDGRERYSRGVREKIERRGLYMSITRWIDENETPNLVSADRLIALIYDLGITTKEQLVTLTGWPEQRVVSAIKAIRNKVRMPERLKLDQRLLRRVESEEIKMDESDYAKLQASVADRLYKLESQRDKWLVIYRPDRNRESYYTLGAIGVEYACAMHEEPSSRWKIKPKNQMNHFVGVNEILCRLRRIGIQEEEWFGGKETAQELYYHFERFKRKHKSARKDTLYWRPDAYLRLPNGEDYFLEFDTGHERSSRLRKRFTNCLKLYHALADVDASLQPPTVWVVRSKQRKETIERIGKEVLEDWRVDNPSFDIERLPSALCLIEGQDTDFFLGKFEPVPFW